MGKGGRAAQATGKTKKDAGKPSRPTPKPKPAKVKAARKVDKALAPPEGEIGEVRKKAKRFSSRKPPPPSAPPAFNWQATLATKRNGDVLPNRANVATILRYDRPELVRFNEFSGAVEKLQPVVGHKSFRPTKALRKVGPWADQDTVQLEMWLEKSHDLTCELQVVRDSVGVEARRNSYHPIRDYLEGLTWDGRGRLDSWLIRHALVGDSRYVRAVSAKWVLSCVARIYDPGCQVDHVLIIEGQGRAGKTSLLRTLAGETDWFTSTDAELGSKDVLQLIAAVWIAELGELESLTRTDWERVKHFITNTVDRYRPAYGHEVVTQPRCVVLAATTNKFSGYLREADQRFWPVRSRATAFNQVRRDDLKLERDQLWAEAVHRYKAGEPWHITDVDILRDAIGEQEARRMGDPWEPRIRTFLKESNRKIEGVSTTQIAKFLGLQLRNLDRGVEMRIAGILHALEWVRVRSQNNGARNYKFFPSDSDRFD